MSVPFIERAVSGAPACKRCRHCQANVGAMGFPVALSGFALVNEIFYRATGDAGDMFFSSLFGFAALVTLGAEWKNYWKYAKCKRNGAFCANERAHGACGISGRFYEVRPSIFNRNAKG